MAVTMRILLLLALTTYGAAVKFLSAPAKVTTNKTSVAAVAKVDTSISAQVATLRTKLAKISGGLTKMLDAKSGSLAGTKVAESMSAFEKELTKTLKETEGAKDAAALKRLQNAQASVHSLVKDMTKQQVQLMKESQEQQRSLLLGVLMTRKDEPMEKQLEVLRSPEFQDLPDVKAVLAAHDMDTPLFQQIAKYADRGSNNTLPTSTLAAEIPSKLKLTKDGKPDVTPIVTAMNKRIQHLEESEKRRAALHAKEMQQLEAAATKQDKTNKGLAHRVRLMKKNEDRKFAKEAALTHKDVVSLKAAVEAIKKGDIKALEKAQHALKASLEAMKAQSGRFLVLIQMTHRLEGLDCPYCAAQCVDKCHTEGKSYVTCLTECADAGK